MDDTSVSGARVARELHALVRTYGKPQQNALIETFNSSLRAEVLNEEGLDSLEDAQRKLARWRYDDNQVRPHSSLAHKTPAETRRALDQFEGSAHAALARTDDQETMKTRPTDTHYE